MSSKPLAAMAADPYQVLGVTSTASSAEIKAAYRQLVKRHHPDAGGDEQGILALNAAWEVLGDSEHRRAYDRTRKHGVSVADEAHQRGVRNARASAAARATKGQAAAADEALVQWIKQVYVPIDRLLGQVINPFPAQFRSLSADPYDDSLMEVFCTYLEQSGNRLETVNRLYRALPIPASAQGFGLSLYHCLSQVEDALAELERYTMGYVDSYLHDGREMLREAKKRRLRLKEERRRLEIS